MKKESKMKNWIGYIVAAVIVVVLVLINRPSYGAVDQCFRADGITGEASVDTDYIAISSYSATELAAIDNGIVRKISCPYELLYIYGGAGTIDSTTGYNILTASQTLTEKDWMGDIYVQLPPGVAKSSFTYTTITNDH